MIQIRRNGLSSDAEQIVRLRSEFGEVNTGLGDALIFRISGELKHRVAPMEGDEAKTAFAGWFRSDLPDFFDALPGTD